MKRINNVRGFTLIELLVVIAIIGILSSVVLASLNAARGKGANAAVKSGMANMRAQASLFYENQIPQGFGTAGTSCSGAVFADPVIANAILAIQNANGSTATVCRNSTTQWMMSAPLKVSEGTYVNWCVDDSGSSKGQTAAQVAAYTNSTYVCP